ncbi:hypothetical protein [Halobacteriovorax marinus]|nr:hypothetical protein [Halobacteriovorax marinus]
MNELRKYISNQRKSLKNYLRSGYFEYASQMYFVLIKSIKNEVQDKEYKAEDLREELEGIGEELSLLKEEGYDDVYSYYFFESNLMSKNLSLEIVRSIQI